MATFDLGKVVGATGAAGKGISSITKTGTSGLVDTYTITYTDNTTSTFTVTNGADGSDGQAGAAGKGITSISKTGTSGLVDTYTITYSDSTTSTFTVTNGSDASVTIVTSFGSTTSDSKVPSEKLTKTELDKKIAKSETSGLVKNDGSIDTNSYLKTSDIYDGLDSTATNKALSANQGKALATLIGNAITYINQ